MSKPAAAPPTPWSPWAPDCPVPWTAAQKRKLYPRRGSAAPIEPVPLEDLLAAAELRAESQEDLHRTSRSFEADPFSLFGKRPVWLRLRHLLCAAPDTDWTAALQAAGKRREGASLEERIAISFLFPDVLEWGEADAREALARPTVRVGCLATCVRDGGLLEQIAAVGRDPEELLARFVGDQPPEISGVVFSLVEGCGPGAVPSLVRLLDQARSNAARSAGDRRTCAEALALLPDAAAFDALASRLDLKEATAAAGDFARRLPRIALPVLAAQVAREPKGPAAALLSAIAGSEAALIDELLPGLPEAARKAVEAVRGRGGSGLREAAPEELPPVLASPPWESLPKSRQKDEDAAALTLKPLRTEKAVVWEEGERDQWLGAVRAHSLFGSALDRFAWFFFRTISHESGMESLHPRRWLALHQDSEKLMPALVKATEAQPEAGIDLCLPFCSPRLAPIVAREHLRRPRVRAAARRWLARHAECAALTLIPPAVGAPGKEREEAEVALLWLAESGHRETVTAAAARYGKAAPAAVEALLEADPLLRLPAKLPRLPAFWVPASFTRPRLRDRDAVLPLASVDALGTMLAISPLGDPYAGVVQVREACDAESLGRFAWDLFSAWLAAGAPSKEAWAYHALAALGDDEHVRRLGALVRDDWPSAGEHNRAIAGLDILEAIGSEAALFQLHRISQKGATKGIRDRAGQKLESVAAQRGLTPDDLEDFLLPTFGLGPDGSLALTFGPRSFRVGFDELLRPIVQDSDGKRLKDLPKPGAADDAKVAEPAVRAWKDLKKDVKAVAGQRLRGLEQAMCARRRQDARMFGMTQVQHPLAGHLARRLVWGAWDAEGLLRGTFRICEDLTFAGPSDDPWELPEGVRIGLIHPLDLDEPVLAAWSALFADYEILQPFAQLGREVFRCSGEETGKGELTRYAGLQLPTGKLLGLESRGWKRGEPLDGPVSYWTDRPAAGPRRVVTVEFEPGIMNGMPLHYPEQKIARIALVNADDRKPADVTFGDLDPVTFSEIVRDLETLR